jgi:hypothetical protein
MCGMRGKSARITVLPARATGEDQPRPAAAMVIEHAVVPLWSVRPRAEGATSTEGLSMPSHAYQFNPKARPQADGPTTSGAPQLRGGWELPHCSVGMAGA